ncbi:CpaF/VirB11 family protein [Ruminococcaceae bacterium OttesenSCG-928-D13]|nr:CpaF/VirB11 family protein [Ruminococcaceae bacterium OttesenSCG-928-D13]
MLSSQSASTTRSRSLFFTPENDGRDFSSVLADVQEYVSSKYSTLITDGGDGDAKEQIKRYISKYVQDHRIAVKGLSGSKLVDALYTEMAEFGFLTKYIFGTGIEEINVNSWRDIEVLYSNGKLVKLEERFDSPDHAINVIRRMLHVSGMVLDNASPAVLGHLSKNIRIAVLKTPLVDEDVGICASIRIVNPQSMKKEDFVRGGTATEEMMDFLSECLRYGISICVAGATGSGKTTVAGWLLTTIPHNKRIFTIENGSRELDLVREQDGRVSNSVIHTITRESENDKQNIDQDILLDMALRFHPDVICVGEMRSAEAYTAQEAARTGHAVLSTVHSNSCEATWRRIVTLCKRKYDMADDTLMDLVSEAFPIVVFAKQLENKERKLMEIMECEILPDGSRRYNTLFRFAITENRLEDGEFVIGGHHEAVSPISAGLQKRFMENGMPQELLDKLLESPKGKEGGEAPQPNRARSTMDAEPVSLASEKHDKKEGVTA